ncbi:hypothetical protein B0H16DRAFT_1693115 [Mycena metata]|uniref:Uncharacterized protein n=1 Tax=Mycena metata TaxID=1033252 RepID=A0AAD7DMK5_9AGAR|nr:hypothetical protein B0H16DRAFT_860355 [Mycena metata]KAJ7744922.1 hypothetical protein B0H16DRAFT_1693115 [Mycena metata]
MRFTFSLFPSLLAVTLASTATVAALGCSEASRFGDLTVTPATLAPGDAFTVNVDLTCAADLGYLPTYMDYYIEVLTNNNGHELPILLARRTFAPVAGASPSDTLITELPPWTYFEHAQYSVVFIDSFARLGPNNNTVIIAGEVSASINITGGI